MAHRTQITLADEQYERLRAESARTGLGLAELVRRALERTYGSSRPEATLAALDSSFGGWRDHDVDGSGYVENLRRGLAARLTEE